MSEQPSKTLSERFSEKEIKSKTLDRWDEKSASELRAELAKVTECLSLANANHEKFERLWYLEKDKLEAVEAEIQRLKAFEDWVIEKAAHQWTCDYAEKAICTCGLNALLNQKEAK